MAWNLTNPALQYDSPPILDSATGLPVQAPPQTAFFKNKALRAMQFAHDAAQQAQPGTSTVNGTLGEPSVSQGAEMLPGPVSASVPSSEYSPGQDQTTVGQSAPPTPTFPKFIQPKFSDVSQGQNGLPTPVNAGETKLGKLLHVIRLAAEGAATGSQAGTFGGGFEAASQAPYQDAMRNFSLQSAGLQNQAQQANIAMLPWQRMQQIANYQKAQGEAAKAPYITPRSGGVFDPRTGKYLAGAGPTEHNQTGDQQAIDYLTSNPDPQLGRPLTPPEAVARVAQLKQDVKPDTGAQSDLEYQNILKKESLKQPLTPEEKATKVSYEKRKTLGPRTTFNLQHGAGEVSALTPRQEAQKQAIIEGRMNPPSAFAQKTPYWQSVMGQVLIEDPNWSEQRAQLRKNYVVPQGNNAATQIGGINTAMGHIGVLGDAITALNNGNINLLNSVANRLGVAVGQSPVTTFNTIVHRVGPEISKAYIGAGGSAGERGADEKDFDPKLGPKQLGDNVAITAKLLRSKIGSLEKQWEDNAPANARSFEEQFLTKEAKAALDKFSPQGGVIFARDPSGQLHQAPAGSPLPSGWKQEN